MEITQKSKVYIQIDSQSRINRCEGGYTTPSDLTGWLEIDEGYGDRFNLCQSHFFDGGLYTQDGICRYKYTEGSCTLRTDEEIATDRANIPSAPPSQFDRIEAQTMYTALLTDTLIEEE